MSDLKPCPVPGYWMYVAPASASDQGQVVTIDCPGLFIPGATDYESALAACVKRADAADAHANAISRAREDDYGVTLHEKQLRVIAQEKLTKVENEAARLAKDLGEAVEIIIRAEKHAPPNSETERLCRAFLARIAATEKKL